MSAYGYGDTSETYTKNHLAKHEYDKYKGTASNVLRVTAPGSYVQQTSCTDTVFWCMHRVGASEILHGDSGGPWVTNTSNPFVVGLTSVVSGPQQTSNTTVVWQYAGATQMTNSKVHDWVSTTAGLIQPKLNTIYRDPSTGASWLAEADGFDHPIPTGSTYLCLTGQGDAVVNLPTFDLDEIPQSTDPATCTGSAFSSGDLLVGVGNGLVAHYSATGNFISRLDTGTGSTYETGGCFTPSGEYYQTNFSDGSVTKFSASGTVENSRWATLSGTPESCVVAPDGTVYVGDAAGALDQLASDGTLKSVMYPQTEYRGIDWLSWRTDNCTLRYTSEGPTVFQYNVCTTSQETTFATAANGGPCYENAPLADGGMLVACSSAIVRLDSAGNTVATFPAPGSGGVFALAVTPSASSFYVADLNGSNSSVYQIDLATGATLASFTPSPEVEIDGLTLVP